MPATPAQTSVRAPDHPSRGRVAPRGESELRASLLDALGEAVVASDVAGRIIYWNDAARELLGWTAGEAIGADVEALIAAEGSSADAATILRHLQAGESWSGDFFVRHRDGRSFPVHATTTPVRDRRGRVVGMVGVARDLSAQRDAEEALRRTEERLELVHRAAVSVIWEWDLLLGQRHWNDSLEDVFGYHPAAAEGSLEWWEERVHPDDRPRVSGSLTSALEEGRRFWTEEYRFRRQDGTYATVFDRAYVAVDGGGKAIRVVGTMMDLTERRRSHEAARFLSQAGMLLDLSLDYAAVLPGLARLATQTVADACVLLVGAPGEVEDVFAAAADPRREQPLARVAERLGAGPVAGTLIARVFESGESLRVHDVEALLRSNTGLEDDLRALIGEVGMARAVLAPMTVRGRTVGAVVLGRGADSPAPGDEDVRVAEELGRRIGLAVDNARLFHSAELARRAKADFLSVVSHEIRTPLTAVMGYAELLAAQVAGTLNEAQRKQVARLRTGADKLLSVIEGILTYARLEAGQERVQLERVPPGRLLERVRSVVAPHAAERGVRYTEDAVDAPRTLCVDVEKMIKVLVALLTNAVKFSGEGGTCALRVAAVGDELVFDVTDSGPGIQAADLPNLFSPFWQAEQPEVRRAGGSGLGLSVARRLARLMGGEVSVLDTSEQGTTFRVVLPSREDA